MSFPLFDQLKPQFDLLTPSQSAFIAGYLWAKSDTEKSSVIKTITETPQQKKITILSGSQTGNAKLVADQLQQKIPSAQRVCLGDYKAKNLSKEDIVFLVCSTQGEGEPPEEAIPFYRFLTGKKSPNLSQLKFAVFGLGDSSYPDFCQAGKDFDKLLEKHGGKRLLKRVDADLDFTNLSEKWINEAFAEIEKIENQTTAFSTNSIPASELAPKITYTKESPFNATLINRHALTDINSEKETIHLEIDLSDSDISYQAGDTLGIIVKNSQSLVDEILSLAGLSAETQVYYKENQASISHVMINHLDLNQLTPNFIEQYQVFISSEINLTASQTNLANLLTLHPPSKETKTLTTLLLSHLKPLIPRLYSIASSQSEVDEEAHLCISRVSFNYNNKTYYGCASDYLSEIEEGDSLDIFVEPNPRFKLPKDNSKPIIMIGAGTGIAPFRGFMQERESQNATGENWLFFGNRNARLDFLYQSEWIKYRDSGLLNQIDLAWSRPSENCSSDNKQKIYIQNKLEAKSHSVWQWIEKGAYIYVCGDAKNMAKAVDKTLIEIIKKHGKKDDENAQDYLDTLREEQRYQRDVY